MITDRHSGRGTISYTDGHAETHKFQRTPRKHDAWRVYYELTDGRIITTGYWYNTNGKPIRFGYLRNNKVNGIVYQPGDEN
mgnify:CR=1 FL=1